MSDELDRQHAMVVDNCNRLDAMQSRLDNAAKQFGAIKRDVSVLQDQMKGVLQKLAIIDGGAKPIQKQMDMPVDVPD